MKSAVILLTALFLLIGCHHQIQEVKPTLFINKPYKKFGGSYGPWPKPVGYDNEFVYFIRQPSMWSITRKGKYKKFSKEKYPEVYAEAIVSEGFWKTSKIINPEELSSQGK